MTNQKKPQGATKDKAAPAIDPRNLPALLNAVLTHPDAPTTLVNHVHRGLDAMHDDLKDSDVLTDSVEYLTCLFAQHRAERGGAR